MSTPLVTAGVDGTGVTTGDVTVDPPPEEEPGDPEFPPPEFAAVIVIVPPGQFSVALMFYIGKMPMF
ncbi:hypothetical protein Q0F98_33790 [Paenibacillus amylolyticus]|nr:hypothetical protein Q0F98_33790 [Paenibacillus amylolyticus]